MSGIGAGKSKIGAYDVLQRARPGRLYVVAAPTYRMLQDSTLRSFKEVSTYLGRWVRWRASEFSALIRTRWGGLAEVLFRSCEDPDKNRGPNLSGVWIDEASQVGHEAYRILTGRLREKGEAGWITCTFTPRGQLHWTFEVFGNPKPGVHLTHARTDENPFLHEDFLSDVKESHAGLIGEQELGGAFINLGDVEWGADLFDWPGFWFRDWPDDVQYRVIALDPSKGRRERNDYSAFVVLGLDSKGIMHVDAHLMRESAERQAEFAVGLHNEYRPWAFGIETVMMQALFLPLFNIIAQKRGVELPLYALNTKGVDKDIRIRRLGPYLARRELRFRDTAGGRELVKQLKSFPLANDPKSGVHDDGPDALEHAIRLLRFMLRGRKATEDQGAPVPYGGG